MFTTQSQDEVAGPALFEVMKTRAWRRVSMDMSAPYVLVDRHIAKNGIWLSQPKTYTFPKDLMALCAEVQNQPGIRINQVALLSPPTINLTAGWKLDTLSEIWLWTNLAGNCPILIYVTEDGRRYIDDYAISASGFETPAQIYKRSEWQEERAN
jgi:hypothetical protein